MKSLKEYKLELSLGITIIIMGCMMIMIIKKRVKEARTERELKVFQQAPRITDRHMTRINGQWTPIVTPYINI